DRGDSLHQIAKVSPGRWLRQRSVAVRVQVDEPGCHYETGAVDDAWLTGNHEASDSNDALATDGEIAFSSGLVSAVIEQGAAHNEVGLNRIVGDKEHEQDQHGRT